MKFSSCILFLGWWLAGQWRLSRGQLYPKPSISVIPHREVILGETVRISCANNGYQDAKFHLFKVGNSWELQVQQTPWSSPFKGVSFSISNAQQSDGGTYWCIYCFSEGQYRQCSFRSDTVSIIIIGQVYPKPSIWVSPAPGEMVPMGGNVNIHCKSEQHQKAEFTLHKEVFLDTYKMKKAESDEVVFPIVKAERSEGGIYRCGYCIRSDFYHACSNYSDRVYINITDPSYSKPSIKVRPEEQVSPGWNISIECQGAENFLGLTFFLLKSGKLIASQVENPKKNTTKFLLSRMRLEDAGNYTCQYHRVNPFVWSEPSDPVELIVTDRFQAILWSSIAAGLLVLVLLLLVLAFVLYRKRRKGSTTSERAQPVNIVRNFPPLEPDTGEDPDGISYAVLSHHSLKTEQAADAGRVPESCTYASVAQGTTRESH